MKTERLISGILVLAGILYGASYVISRRPPVGRPTLVVMLDYSWITTGNGLAETLYAMHQPLIAIDHLLSGVPICTLVPGTPPVTPTVVAPSKKISPAP